MRLKARIALSSAVFVAATVCAATLAWGQQSSSQTQQTANQQQTTSNTTGVGTYVSTDPLAKVRYDNRYDLSLAYAYDHMKAGATLLQGSNLSGVDLEGSYWLNRNWGIQASGRGYFGNALPAPSALPYLKRAAVRQYFFVAGPEWLGPHNKRGAILAHAMFGGVYGSFEKDLQGRPPAQYDFYYDQISPAAIIGGHFDLNRSARWSFRVTPDAVMTHYKFSNAPYTSQKYAQYDVNFAISFGVQYKFTSIKRSTKKANWQSGW
jgi:hypothetical protein